MIFLFYTAFFKNCKRCICNIIAAEVHISASVKNDIQDITTKGVSTTVKPMKRHEIQAFFLSMLHMSFVFLTMFVVLKIADI